MSTRGFQNHMKNYAFDCVALYFPWHWLKQKKDWKAAFFHQLREIYLGICLDTAVAHIVGNNIEDKRNCLMTKFQIYKSKKVEI